MRRLILKIHLVIGLIVGAFMVLLGITGSIMAFEPELDELLHRDLSYVNAIGRVFSLADIAAAVSRSYGDEPIIAFLPATSPHVPVQVITSRGIVAVNQYTGAVLGVRTRGQTLLGFVRALHVVTRWSACRALCSSSSVKRVWAANDRRPYYRCRPGRNCRCHPSRSTGDSECRARGSS